MAVLTWDELGDHLFETGISKGVLYKADGYGVAWSGLTSIEEKTSNDVEPVFFDGVKFNDIITLGGYAATLRAFTYPDEFAFCQGVLEDQTGFFVANQTPSRFGLSYQTIVGNDIEGVDYAYRIHVLYNLSALPTDREFASIADTIEPVEFEWDITGIPEEIENFRPTVHIIFDSRKIDPHLLNDIEDLLYGNETDDAYLPSLKGLSSFIRKWDRLIITDHGDGTWSADSQEPDIITIDGDLFTITSDTAEYLDADTYTISSSEKNEEDIWLP